MIHKRQIALAILFGTLCWDLPAQVAKPASAKPDPWVKQTLKDYRKLISDRKGAQDPAAIELIKYDRLAATASRVAM